jgi:hypothetical protein
MTTTVLTLDQAERFFSVTFPARLRNAVKRGLFATAMKLVNEIRTKLIAAATPQPVDRGVYRAGWTAKRTDDGALYENLVPWAPFVEFGVRGANVKPGRAMLEAERMAGSMIRMNPLIIFFRYWKASSSMFLHLLSDRDTCKCRSLHLITLLSSEG